MTRAPDVYLSNCPHCGAEVEIDHIEPHTHKIATWMPDHPRALRVPLSGDAMVILRQQRESVDKSCLWVFPNGGNDGEPFNRANNSAWRTMRDKLGLPWLRFHDLRHTWASWHVMAGTPLEVLQQLGGWRSLAMVMRYAHLAPSHVDSYADRISGPRVLANPKKAGKGNR